MKKMIVAGLLIAGLAGACTPASVTTSSVGLPEAVLMKISCRDDISLKEQLFNQLHVKKAKDIMSSRENGWLFIQATFVMGDVPLYVVQDLQTDFRQLSGMLSVDLEWNKTGTYTSPSIIGHMPVREDAQLIH